MPSPLFLLFGSVSEPVNDSGGMFPLPPDINAAARGRSGGARRARGLVGTPQFRTRPANPRKPRDLSSAGNRLRPLLKTAVTHLMPTSPWAVSLNE